MSETYNGRTVSFAANHQQPPASPSDEIRLSEVLEEYLAQFERGERPDRGAIVSRHPDLADQLHACLDGLDLLQHVVPELHKVSGPVPASAPEALGDFRILRELGRGGMGIVYEAEQLSLGRRIALKVLPFAAILDKQQLARFKNEARAAATLDHPNIVAIYSVGSDRGVHYYAMQLIEGQSLAEIISEMKPVSPPSVEKAGHVTALIKHPTTVDTEKAALPTLRTSGSDSFSNLPPAGSREYCRTIARLGIQAAEALDHAHQNGILHRDIKPANLLLDDTGKLWITDFGVARIEADAGMTMTGDILGTLRYMAPEQALAKRVVVDQRADIYSLGATLYELLTLQPAFGETDRSELIKQIAFEEPRPLRKLVRQIPAELETIVLKAMAKIPDDRYQAAHQLVDDLQAYIEDRPIKAKPPTFLTRTAKWSRRHVAVVWAAAVVLLISTVVLTVASLLVAKWYHEAKHQRQVASAQLNEAQKQERTAATISKLLVDMLSSTNPDPSKGNDYTVRQMLDDFAGRLSANQLADQPEVEAALRATVGNAYCRLGFNDLAAPHLNAALDLKRTALGPNHTDVADSLVDLAWNLVHSNRDQAIGSVQNALQIYRNNDAAPDRMIHALWSLQTFQLWGGNFVEAEAAAREALTIAGDLTSTQVPDVASILTVLAEQKRQQKKYDEAEQLARQSVTLHRRLHGERHLETASGLSTLGRVLFSQEKMNDAEVAFRETIHIRNGRNHGLSLSYLEKILAAKEDQRGLDALRDKEMAIARKEVALFPNNTYSHSNLGDVLIRYGHLKEAIAAYREAIRLNPSFSVAHYQLGNALRRNGQIDDAIHSYQNTIRLDSNYLEAHLALGKLHLQKGNPDEAVSVLQQAVQLKPRDSTVFRDLWDAYMTLGDAYYRMGLLEEALSSFKRALDLNPDSTSTLNSLAWCLATASEDGLRDGKRSIELGQKACALTEYKHPGYVDTLAAAYAEAGDFESAALWSEKAIGLTTDEKVKEECAKHLAKFKAGQPWRE